MSQLLFALLWGFLVLCGVALIARVLNPATATATATVDEGGHSPLFDSKHSKQDSQLIPFIQI